MLRRLFPCLALFVTLMSLSHQVHAQAVYPPYPVGYPPPPPIGEAPMGLERRQRFFAHPYVIFEFMPINDWRYDTASGGDSDVGIGGSLTAGYISNFGLGLELRAGARHHDSQIYDDDDNAISFSETEVPILGGFRYNIASIWGGGFVEPFLAAHFGTGGFFRHGSADLTYNEWDFMFDIGAGLDFYVNEWVALGASYWFEYYAYSADLTMHSLGVQLTL
jgi:hypothetical protein